MPAVLLEVGFINNDIDNQLFDSKFNEIAEAIADGIMETLSENKIASASVSADVRTDVTAAQATPANNTSDNNNNSSASGDTCTCPQKLYRVQVGAYRNKESADRILNSLLTDGYPAFIIFDDGLFKIQVGAYEFLANAIAMEEQLRKARYNTYITT
jgi:N-acetylmuramoyl-L-alanine amidase